MSPEMLALTALVDGRATEMLIFFDGVASEFDDLDSAAAIPRLSAIFADESHFDREFLACALGMFVIRERRRKLGTL